jgi:hypothetical protein
MLKIKQKNKWIEAGEDELISFALNRVMSKKPSIPSNAKALPLKWIFTVKKDLKGNIARYKSTTGSTWLLSNIRCRLHRYV